MESPERTRLAAASRPVPTQSLAVDATTTVITNLNDRCSRGGTPQIRSRNRRVRRIAGLAHPLRIRLSISRGHKMLPTPRPARGLYRAADLLMLDGDLISVEPARRLRLYRSSEGTAR